MRISESLLSSGAAVGRSQAQTLQRKRWGAQLEIAQRGDISNPVRRKPFERCSNSSSKHTTWNHRRQRGDEREVPQGPSATETLPLKSTQGAADSSQRAFASSSGRRIGNTRCMLSVYLQKVAKKTANTSAAVTQEYPQERSTKFPRPSVL